MKIRSRMHLDGRDVSLQLYPVLQETWDHLVLKLAAAVLYHASDPIVVASPEQHPALSGQEHAPDLIQADLTNQVRLWLECGKTTLHKLAKASRRHREARMVMLLGQPHEGRQMMEALQKEGLDRIDVWTFADGEYRRWKQLVREDNDLIGEADEQSMNLVINGEVFVTELRKA